MDLLKDLTEKSVRSASIEKANDFKATFFKQVEEPIVRIPKIIVGCLVSWPVHRYTENQMPFRLEDAMHFPQRSKRIGHMLQDFRAHDCVERPILHGQIHGRAYDIRSGAIGEVVRTDIFRRARKIGVFIRSVPAADIEQAPLNVGPAFLQ